MTESTKFLKLFILIFFPLAVGFMISTAYAILFNVSYLDGGWLWDLSQEKTIATYFESILFLFCSASFYFLSRSYFKIKEKFPKIISRFFKIVSLFFFFLALDESIEIHENIGIFIENKFGILEKTAIEKVGYSWLIIYVPVFLLGIIFFLFFIKSTKKLWRTLRKNISGKVIILLLVAFSGALATFGLEFLDAYYRINNHSNQILPWIEESSEIISIFSILGICYLLLREKE